MATEDLPEERREDAQDTPETTPKLTYETPLEERRNGAEETRDVVVPTITTEAVPEDDEPPPPPVPEKDVDTPTDSPSRQPSPFHPDERPGSRPQVRHRTDSQSTMATTATHRSTRSSLVFVVQSLESISASKEARKNKKLAESLQRALGAIKSDADPSKLSPEVLFEPLQLASEVQTVQVVTTALDCIGKLISYSYFSTPSESPEQEGPPLIERAIDTICDCFQSEATPVDIQLQIVKSLLAAILNDKIVVHGAGLLKAVRLTYNIFLLSKSTSNQMLAQTALTQMVGTVFERVKTRMELKEARMNSKPMEKEEDGNGVSEDIGSNMPDEDESSEAASAATSDVHVPTERREAPKITLQSFENRKSFDDAKITESAPTLVTRVKPRAHRTVSGHHDSEGYEDEEDEIYIRDAYLVFRAMCRLSTKALSVDHALDVKSQGMRSKLLALHIIYTLLNNHTSVFTSPYATIRSSSSDEPTSFIQAIKQYLCLSLSRNGASSARAVFEVSCEIFWLMLKYLRVMLKKEIEVFMKEVYLAILDKRAAPAWQKQMILGVLSRLGADPRALVEVYLNYDCDRTALDNMFERIVEHLSRISSAPVSITSIQLNAYQEHHTKVASSPSDWQHRVVLPSLSTASIQAPHDHDTTFPAEYAMKHESLEALVEILRSLVNWSQQGVGELAGAQSDFKVSMNESRESLDRREFSGTFHSPHLGANDSPGGMATPVAEDDPNQFDREKQRKTALANAIRQFNFKPKRGLKVLLREGFIKSDDPQDIARFFLGNERVNKASLGEFLGEGDPENVAIMHAFVDQMDFRQTRFVDALRRFLQSFRLPGEAQKIDRFMLKFAERYITGNPKAFANADTAYVLAYSVIMLNTDQHSSNVKRRMTPEDFIKNNRGINDNADLPDEYLRAIFEEIAHNEIVLDTERETAANLGTLAAPAGGLATTIGQAVANVGRDYKREEYAQTEQIANRTEQLYKSLLRAQRKGASKAPVAKFVPASSSKHVGPMFQVTWMPFLTALSGAAQDTNDIGALRLCMEGQKLAIRIACLFDLSDPRQAFVASLSRFTNLYNLSEMKTRNVEALKCLLDVALIEGNLLKDSWRDILTCVSQLDRFQLISTGVDEGAVPDVGKIHSQSQKSSKKLQVPKGHRPRAQSAHMHYQAEVAEETRSTDIIRQVDRIFTNTANLSGDAILHFVRALTQVSWQEIQSSGQSESPRTYSLQKIVEISGYNMTRVRFEWASIWQVLGQHFIQVGCHTNTHVVFFALDSLRQLSMRFLDIEELPGFKFQKDFWKPFELIIGNTTAVPVKDMVLRCLIQMIQARGKNIRSGWRTMFGVFTVAAREPYEGIVNLAYDNVTQIYNTYFGVVISQGAFADLIVCLTQFSKNQKFQKKSLQAIEMLKSTVYKMLRTPECPLSRLSERAVEPAPPKQPSRQTDEEQFWFPVLFAFHDVLMTGDDLEVRSRALNYLFETLMKYGGDFPLDFWDTLWRQLLYPIFMVLRSKSEMQKFATNEELSVWLSTTMIQALRNMITLFTHFFDSLEYMLDRFLDLLTLCICQENDTLARIGSNCLQQLILQNVSKFTPEHWRKIIGAFIELFQRTEATALFSAATSGSYKSNGHGSTNSETASLSDLPLSTPASEQDNSLDNALGINGLPAQPRSRVTPSEPVQNEDGDASAGGLEDYHPDNETQVTPVVVTAARRRFFNQIITKCVLTLLMIETVNELFSNDAVYAQIPSPELLRLMALLKKSYHFARRFNEDRALRTKLFKEGFMKQPPNLLKQESGAAAVYVSILFRMYHDSKPERVASRAETEAALVPLCADIVGAYAALDDETQQRNIVTWRPVVVDVLEGYAGFPEEEFAKHVPTFAPLAVALLGREMGPELQRAVQGLMARIFEVKLGLECAEWLSVGRAVGSPVETRRRGSWKR
ncbi:hypothetical protein EJ06DRAFT_492014 [Trichodelitschia bisporula]|uniref:SEC7 domain-containing protein n=1 Tax=Trichodelitschia bisporula TaxID=703511 RepID=A0A6G1I193_9PEZI|nr:hypothetical protein EJ06DRAFT_492014 [Trichodelitschia bisporula]